MKMTELKNSGYLRFGLAVAIACSNSCLDSSAEDAASHLESILKLALASTGIQAEVSPMAYPACSKIPLIITINGVERRLLWYYPQMSVNDLADELYGLLADALTGAACVPA